MEMMPHNHSNMSMPMPGSNSSYNNDSMMNMGDMTMHMSFYWGKDVVVLFSGWPGSHRLGMYILALVVVFLLAVGAEFLSAASSVRPRGLRPAAGALALAIVFAVRMGLAYLVMLSVMSYNLGVFVVAVVGHAVGCFVVKYRALVAVDQGPGSTA